MTLAGIVVGVAAPNLEAAAAWLAALPGVEVHQRDPAGRLVVVQEAESAEDQEAGLRRIQALPDVLYAALVYDLPGIP